MSEALSGTPAPPPKQDPETLELRGRPRPVVRFRRGLIIGVTAAVSVSLAGLAWLALDPPASGSGRSPRAGHEPVRNLPDDALAALPSDYGHVPRLGPPLPGDLGRPILEHRRSRSGEAAGQPESATAAEKERARKAAEAERRRLAAQLRSARSSPVLVKLRGASRGEAGSAEWTSPKPGPVEVSPEAAPRGRQGSAGLADAGPSRNFVRSSPSRWTLSAGTVVPASLITGINSDLPGIVIAQVTENVRDSATGTTILIPQGARLIGSYGSNIGYGQRRALLVWTRMVFPDGSSVLLDDMPATDASGYSGVADRVDSHTWQLLKGVALSTLLGVGTEVSLGSSESELVRAIRRSTQQNAADAGDRVTARSLSVEPTITVRPGWPVRAVVNSDLVLEPWTG